MDYKEYKQMVIETEIGSLTNYPKTLHAIMGMNGEAGECIDILKKHMFQGHKFDEDHFLNELGDVCWYTMLLIVELDINPDFIFNYIERLIHVNSIKEKPTYKGLNYILDLNNNCGGLVDLYYDSHKEPMITMLGGIRSIFYNVTKVANIFDKTLDNIFDINYSKIKKRYPDGFTPELSVGRGNKYGI